MQNDVHRRWINFLHSWVIPLFPSRHFGPRIPTLTILHLILHLHRNRPIQFHVFSVFFRLCWLQQFLFACLPVFQIQFSFIQHVTQNSNFSQKERLLLLDFATFSTVKHLVHNTSLVYFCFISELRQMLLKNQFEQLTHLLPLHHLLKLAVIRGAFRVFWYEFRNRELFSGELVFESVSS